MEHIFEGRFGLERETLRVTGEGRLAQSPHPFDSPYIDRDFCENQLELITPVCFGIDELMSVLEAMDEEIKAVLKEKDEYLWMYSNPPGFEDEDEIPVAEYSGSLAYKTEYRRFLEQRYGKRLMLYSGIHFNFSFSEKALQRYCAEGECSDKLYFKLSKQVFRYSWLLVLLSAASPVYDRSLDENGGHGNCFCGLASLRSSERGYWNKFVPILDYSDIKSYVSSVKALIDDGRLRTESELYLPVRLKPSGSNNLRSLTENGVDHIELRMFDVNPLSPVGVLREDIEFAHYFLLYLCCLPDFEFTPELQRTAVANYKAAAKFDIDEMSANGYAARDAALGIIDDMTEYFKGYENAEKNILYQRKKITNNERHCVKIYNILKNDYQGSMLSMIKGSNAF